MWLEEGMAKISAKTVGTSVMVSGFICQCHGFFLLKRGLWPQGSPPLRLCKSCKDKIPHNDREQLGYGPNHYMRTQQCCAVYILSQPPDFLAQKEWLTEVVTNKDDCDIIFYPEFHCELNFIELVWAFMKAFL